MVRKCTVLLIVMVQPNLTQWEEYAKDDFGEMGSVSSLQE